MRVIFLLKSCECLVLQDFKFYLFLSYVNDDNCFLILEYKNYKLLLEDGIFELEIDRR